MSGYRNGDPGAHVFRTANGGATWTDISGRPARRAGQRHRPRPAQPGRALRRHRRRRVGRAPAGRWAPVGTGLPLVPVADLEATDDGAATVLTAATFGLGMYRTTA